MVWHDCKTDPPKERNKYIVVYRCNPIFWEQGFYEPDSNKWWDYIGADILPYKWAEVDLSEVE